MTSNIVANDVSYEDDAPISDGSSLGRGEVLCQGCIKLRIISSFDKCKIS
jgi:hypothetical protein